MRISDWSSDVCSSDLGRKAARDTGKLARDLVIFRFLDQLLGDCLRGVAFGRGEQRLRLFGLGDPRRAIKDEGRADMRFVEQKLRLQQFELEPHRPQGYAQQEQNGRAPWRAREGRK